MYKGKHADVSALVLKQHKARGAETNEATRLLKANMCPFMLVQIQANVTSYLGT